VVGGSLINS